MILIIDTTAEHLGNNIKAELKDTNLDFKFIDANDLNISHCLGCNHCWLKTPGICPVKDDYKPILEEMIKANLVLLVSDISLGFVSYKCKNIIDRIMPMVTMYLKIKDGQMRHVNRYDSSPDFGFIVNGECDIDYLNEWSYRVALNMESKSAGVFNINQKEEIINAFNNY